MPDEPVDDLAQSPALGAVWYPSRWGADDQRGNGNLLGSEKIRQALALVRRNEIVRLGHEYDAKIPLAPGRIFGLRMPGGPTGGPHGSRRQDGVERRIPDDRDRPDRHPYGCARPSRPADRRQGRSRQHPVLQRHAALRDLVALWADPARHRERADLLHAGPASRRAGAQGPRHGPGRGDHARGPSGLPGAPGARPTPSSRPATPC